jgi:hypothetical protein
MIHDPAVLVKKCDGGVPDRRSHPIANGEIKNLTFPESPEEMDHKRYDQEKKNVPNLLVFGSGQQTMYDIPDFFKHMHFGFRAKVEKT